MRLADVIISAVIGGAIGFAVSHYVASESAADDSLATLVDERVDARMEAAGLGPGADLDGRISGEIAQFLAEKPEAVVAALEAYQANQAALEAEERRKAVRDLNDALTKQEGDPAFGATPAEADITLVEFFDYRCGYCKRSLESVIALAEEDPKLRIVLKEFPILGPDSVKAAQLSLAANRVDPSQHKGLHEALMRHQGAYDRASLLLLAAASGYDPQEIEKALEDDAVAKQIKNAYDVAEVLGIRGTPAFVVGEEVIPGAVSIDRLRQAIADAREASKG